MMDTYIRGLQFYTFFGISKGIKRRMVDIAKNITFLLQAKCLKRHFLSVCAQGFKRIKKNKE